MIVLNCACENANTLKHPMPKAKAAPGWHAISCAGEVQGNVRKGVQRQVRGNQQQTCSKTTHHDGVPEVAGGEVRLSGACLHGVAVPGAVPPRVVDADGRRQRDRLPHLRHAKFVSCSGPVRCLCVHHAALMMLQPGQGRRACAGVRLAKRYCKRRAEPPNANERTGNTARPQKQMRKQGKIRTSTAARWAATVAGSLLASTSSSARRHTYSCTEHACYDVGTGPPDHPVRHS